MPPIRRPRFTGRERRGRRIDFLYCPHYGRSCNSALSVCPNEQCGLIMTLGPKCGNCHFPREFESDVYCRSCGLKHLDVGTLNTSNVDGGENAEPAN